MQTVRVVIPTYQRGSIVTQAIQSAQAQTFSDLEIVVIDDGSTDGTEESVRRLAKGDSRIRYIRLNNGGAAAARNAAIELPGSPTYVAFLDSDDMWLPHHVQEARQTLEDHSDVGLFFAKVDTIDLNKNMTAEQLETRSRSWSKPVEYGVGLSRDVCMLNGPALTRALVRSDFCPMTSTVVVRASAIQRQPWFNRNLSVFEDCDFFLMVALGGAKSIFHGDVHCRYRLHGDNLTLQRDLSSPRVLHKLQSCLSYCTTKLAYCMTADDRRRVRHEMATYAYLVGQCFAEQQRLPDARRAYFRCLRLEPSRLALYSLGASLVPERIRKPLKRLKKSFG